MALKRKCTGCGYQYDFVAGTVFVCPFCGTVQNPGLSADLTDMLVNASTLRRSRQFNRAKDEYLRVVKEAPEVGESYFGLFLCDYEVTVEEDLLKENANVVFTNATRCPVNENENYLLAIRYSGASRGRWENIAKQIEIRRQNNLRLKSKIKNNKYRVALICDTSSEADKQLAKEIYDKIHTRIDVFYPPETVPQNASEVFREHVTYVALDNVQLLFLVCSESSKKSSYLKNCYKHFFSTHESYLVSVIANNVDDVPFDWEFCDELIPYDSKDLTPMENRIRIMAGFSFEEKTRFRNGEACVNNVDDPSPVLVL